MKTTQNTLSWKKWSTLLGAVAIIGVAGCADRNKNDIPESPATSGEVSNTLDNAGDAAQNAAETAGDAAGNAADTAAEVGTNATITGKINAAYAANPSVSALKINVDTMESNKTVTLSGTVTNDAQKNLAANIAKQNAPGYEIVNNLKTSGGASPEMNGKAG